MKASRYNIWSSRDGREYVFNGVSGAFMALSAVDRGHVERFLPGAAPDATIEPLLTELTRNRVLIADDVDELRVLEGRFKAHRYDHRTLGLTLITSLGCNFDCPYCYEAKHPSIMSPAVEAAILKLVDDSVGRIESLTVTWFGGEPLVGKRPLLRLSDAFIERCDAAGIAYSATMVTNGWHLTRETCEELAARRVNDVEVTLDGPPDIHDAKRPLVGGGPTFWRIVENLEHAVDYFDINVRVNVDTANIGRAEELVQILADRGLAGRLDIGLGALMDYSEANASRDDRARCFSKAEYADIYEEFRTLALRYGFGKRAVLPAPAGLCTAAKTSSLLVGSEGELWKCWDNVGDPDEVFATIFDLNDINTRLHKWLNYDPFANDECRSCMALPVCLGGCPHHAMIPEMYDKRCGNFRFTYQQQVDRFAEEYERKAAGLPPLTERATPMLDGYRADAIATIATLTAGAASTATSSVPVKIGRKPVAVAATR